MADNLLSGYWEFDSRIGGFKRGSAVLCAGAPDSDAEFFAAGVLAHELSAGGAGALVLSTQTPSAFKKAAYKRGLYFAKFESGGTFSFVDAYSRLVGGEDASARIVNGPSDLKGILANIAELNALFFRKGVPAVFLLDSLSGLAVHNSQAMLSQFLGNLSEILKRTDSTLLIVFHEVLEDPSLLNLISPLVNLRVELKQENGTNFAKCGDSGWIGLKQAGAA